MKGNLTYTQKIALQKCKNAVDLITIFSTYEEIRTATESAIKAIIMEWPQVQQMAPQIKSLHPSQKKVVNLYGLLCLLRDDQKLKNALPAIKTLLK